MEIKATFIKKKKKMAKAATLENGSTSDLLVCVGRMLRMWEDLPTAHTGATQ